MRDRARPPRWRFPHTAWITAVTTLALGVQPGGDAAAGAPEDPEEGELLIELRLTTDRSKTESDDGGFSAAVVSDGGLAAVLYSCREAVEETAEAWAEESGVRLIEKKSDAGSLHLAYASDEPPGNFVLDYRVSPELDEARIQFWFRTLENVQLSGDDAGLEPLARKLLRSLQCVPR